MNSKAREHARLTYIHHSIVLVEQYTRSGRAAFLRETMVQDAVLRRLETLADAVGKLSGPLKARHPAVPWREIYGFRNVAAHAYEGINLARVWEIVEQYLPMIKSIVDAELREPTP